MQYEKGRWGWNTGKGLLWLLDYGCLQFWHLGFSKNVHWFERIFVFLGGFTIRLPAFCRLGWWFLLSWKLGLELGKVCESCCACAAAQKFACRWQRLQISAMQNFALLKSQAENFYEAIGNNACCGVLWGTSLGRLMENHGTDQLFLCGADCQWFPQLFFCSCLLCRSTRRSFLVRCTWVCEAIGKFQGWLWTYTDAPEDHRLLYSRLLSREVLTKDACCESGIWFHAVSKIRVSVNWWYPLSILNRCSLETQGPICRDDHRIGLRDLHCYGGTRNNRDLGLGIYF